MNEKYRILNIAQNKKQSSNIFSTKPYGKWTQPNEKVVLEESKCSWSNANQGDCNVIE